MNGKKLIEQIEVQVTIAKMLPACFSRQAIDAIGLLIEAHRMGTAERPVVCAGAKRRIRRRAVKKHLPIST